MRGQLRDHGSMSTQVQLHMSKNRQPGIDPEMAWQQLLARDSTAAFFYAVTTTGVFCRPTCNSRKPLRANVRFFSTTTAAQEAGFRACQRCKPLLPCSGNSMDEVRRYLECNYDRRVSLEKLGHIAGLSPFTVQRQFKKQMGVSPLAYQRSLRAGSLRAALKGGARVTDAVYEAGYGSASRAYDGATLGMTPAKFARGGKSERIGYTTAHTLFGWMVVGATERGLCWLALSQTSREAEASLRAEFPAAEFWRDPALTKWIERAIEYVREGSDLRSLRGKADSLDLRGTVFQLRVWQALRQIPRGDTKTYSQLAREMGEPNATRAVARACATNRVAILVPCHRVVGVSGSLTGYRWGLERKRALLAAETLVNE